MLVAAFPKRFNLKEGQQFRINTDFQGNPIHQPCLLKRRATFEEYRTCVLENQGLELGYKHLCLLQDFDFFEILTD